MANHRSMLRSYIRTRLGADFSKLFPQSAEWLIDLHWFEGDVIGSNKSIPWSNPWKLRVQFNVEICGWPMGVEFRDPSYIPMGEMYAICVAIEGGRCYFQKLGLTKQKKRRGRCDKFGLRGRQMNPAKPRKHRGMIFKSPPVVRGELEEDPIEESP